MGFLISFKMFEIQKYNHSVAKIRFECLLSFEVLLPIIVGRETPIVDLGGWVG